MRQLRLAREGFLRSGHRRPPLPALRFARPVPSFHTLPLRRQIIAATVSLVLLLGAGVFWSAMRAADERRSEVRAEAAAMTTMGAAYLDRYLAGIDAAASVLTR